jgi:hypothetical protein
MLEEDIHAGIVDKKMTVNKVIGDRILKLAQQELRTEEEIASVGALGRTAAVGLVNKRVVLTNDPGFIEKFGATRRSPPRNRTYPMPDHSRNFNILSWRKPHAAR